tara:strand:- start:511 stop:813 length:303 start_codon:yes stop_codon:yes gene_type:complete
MNSSETILLTPLDTRGSFSSSEYLGVTEPISLAYPTESDLKGTDGLLRVLKMIGSEETDEREAIRRQSLIHLQAILREWVADISVKRGNSHPEVIYSAHF